MKRILVVDNDPITLHVLVGMLKNHSNLLQILSAENIQSALEILAKKRIHVLIGGMHIPELDSFKLSLLLSNNSGTRVIIISNKASPQFCAKIKKMPSVIHFDQVLDINLLPKRIFTELQIDYGGQIRGLTLSSLLQVLELEGRSCTLLVTAKANAGTIYLTGGKPTAAKAGNLTGKLAALHILNWQNVFIDIDYKPIEMPLEITAPLMTLLLESGQIMDEDLSQRLNLRQHNRYDCLVGVEYRISDVNYHCYMRDLSEGGAYLETNQPVEVGQRLVLVMYSPMIERSCAINGIVVRRDNKGLGVRFEALILKQKQVIRSLIESCCVPISKPSE